MSRRNSTPRSRSWRIQGMVEVKLGRRHRQLPLRGMNPQEMRSSSVEISRISDITRRQLRGAVIELLSSLIRSVLRL